MHSPLVLNLFLAHKMKHCEDLALALVEASLFRSEVQSVAALYLIFVSFLNAPFDLIENWIDIGPWITLAAFLITFFAVPISEIWQMYSNYEVIQQSQYFTPLLIMPFASVILIVLWIPSQLLSLTLAAFYHVANQKRIRNFKGGLEWHQLV